MFLPLLQVIEEIEEIMQGSPGVEAGHPPSLSAASTMSVEVRQATSSPSFEKSAWVPVGFPFSERFWKY